MKSKIEKRIEWIKALKKFSKKIRILTGDFYILPNKNTVEIFIKDYLVLPCAIGILYRGTYLQSNVNLPKFSYGNH